MSIVADAISKKVYGTEYFMSELLRANPLYRSFVYFNSNVRLKIPDVKKSLLKKKLNPPWES